MPFLRQLDLRGNPIQSLPEEPLGCPVRKSWICDGSIRCTRQNGSAPLRSAGA
jgi:hypothetical protein